MEGQKMNTCPYCIGEMKEKKDMEFEVYRPGYILVVSGLSGYECDRCGERYFDEASTEKIEKAVDKIENIPKLYDRKLSKNQGEMILRIPRELQDAMKLKGGENMSIMPVDRNRFLVSR
jgi:YgiT-type zinc finger domain-containing protein